jgi:3-hydroxybutyryl-CoA dehydrogenase
MGPFEVMDLIGHDVNFAVTASIHSALFGDPRFTPSVLQRELVEAGRLGRKSGLGFYDYTAGAKPAHPVEMPPMPVPKKVTVMGDFGPASPLEDLALSFGATVAGGGSFGRFVIDDVTLAMTDGRSATIRAVAEGIPNLVTFDLARDYSACTRIALAAAEQSDPSAINVAAGFVQSLGKTATRLGDVPGLIVARIVAMLVNEAADAVMTGIASPEDIDTAMMKGVGYPLGPLRWADEVGPRFFLSILEGLQESYREDRYRPSQFLRRIVAAGHTFHPSRHA